MTETAHCLVLLARLALLGGMVAICFLPLLPYQSISLRVSAGDQTRF